MISLLIAAHLTGDFLLQNHWMQAKSRSDFVCAVHVLVYTMPMAAAGIAIGLPAWAFTAIIMQHWVQDRLGLHLIWMKLYRQTPPDMWPVGPLCMDQACHIAFMLFVAFLALA